jgi:hypothetical protein
MFDEMISSSSIKTIKLKVEFTIPKLRAFETPVMFVYIIFMFIEGNELLYLLTRLKYGSHSPFSTTSTSKRVLLRDCEFNEFKH